MSLCLSAPYFAHRKHLKRLEIELEPFVSKINKFLEQNYIRGYSCTYKFDEEISDEFIKMIISEYRAIGWEVTTGGVYREVLIFDVKKD